MKKLETPTLLQADHSRRRFLTGLATSLTGALLLPVAPNAIASAMSAGRQSSRTLSFYHTHTGDKLAIDYHDGMDYLPEALTEINHYLRDFRTDESYPIDMGLLDILHELKTVTGHNGTFEIISGYRSPKTNASLRNKSGGVAKRSLHMQGKAIDVRLTGFDTRQLHKAAKKLAKGGVGYYQKSNFIHVDTGRVRYW
ncbi:MAG: YcbK family protein [Pseudomonadota bacterium]|nr:YcbK family protein [Pseudomonadota bacterium]